MLDTLWVVVEAALFLAGLVAGEEDAWSDVVAPFRELERAW